jgi:phosphonate transport system ATP-binding protein
MSAGRVAFDGCPDDLTDAVARDLYGLEAAEVIAVGRAPALVARQTMPRLMAVGARA